jgi:hypothetical protein
MYKEVILFLTGKLAQKQLRNVLKEMSVPSPCKKPPEWNYRVKELGLSVAALMTGDLILRRLKDVKGINKIILPGRVRVDTKKLQKNYGVPFERGPDELRDIPDFFGRSNKKKKLKKYDIKIFAEIVDAPNSNIEKILKIADKYKKGGANVIDIGCLPDTKFSHLEKTIKILKQKGFVVSVDSADPQELLRGGRAGADYILSLNEKTINISNEVNSIPVLIPSKPGDLNSLYRVIEKMKNKKKPFLADSILDPINYGFTESLSRYRELRKKYPKIDILMGTGNVTELTDADTAGMNALLLGICTELDINNVLVVQVSDHTKRVLEETDLARKIMYAAKKDHSLPLGYDSGLISLHEKKPFTSVKEINETTKMIKDSNFRIQVSEKGVHVYNRDGHYLEQDPFAFFPKINLENDGGHAFYIGIETARAHIAWELGKKYVQDEDLKWGCAHDIKEFIDLTKFKEPGPTMDARQKMKHDLRKKKKKINF